MKKSFVLPITIAALSIGSPLVTPAPVLAETAAESQSCPVSQPQPMPTSAPAIGNAKDLQIAVPQKVNLYCFFAVGTGEKTPINTVNVPIAPEAPKADQLTIFRISL